jgi:hypothetical protein
MPRRLKAGNSGRKVTSDRAGKFRLYTILYHVNEAFEQILGQLQQLDQRGVGPHVSNKLEVIVEETRAEVNFELVEYLQQRELNDWTRFGAARQLTTTNTDSVGLRRNPDRSLSRLTKRETERRHPNI